MVGEDVGGGKVPPTPTHSASRVTNTLGRSFPSQAVYIIATKVPGR